MIIDIKGRLRESGILDILAEAAYMPTPEKMARRADDYESDGGVSAFGYFDGTVRGVIVLKRLEQASYEIISIAASPKHRNEGVGSALISYAAQALCCASLCAETDDDAVGFYKSCGFTVTSLSEKYPGTVRYLCVR
jgi:ribosomal protein S18 acetylase RimI-like enzyme